MQKNLVIGSNGALGSKICDALSTYSNSEVYKGVYGQDDAPEQRIINCDVNDIASIERAISGMDVVIVAVRQKQPNVQAACVKANIACIDVTVESSFVNQVMKNYGDNKNARLVMMCGFFPGMSGLLAHHLAQQLDEVSEINIALLQNTNAKVGRTGVADMLRKVSQDVEFDGETFKGFTKPQKIDFGYIVPKVTTRLVRYDEKNFLQKAHPSAKIGYYTAWNNKLFTKLIALLRKTGILEFLLDRNVKLVPKHDPAKPETVYLTVEVSGEKEGKAVKRAIHLKTASDYGTTAKFVAAATKIVGEGRTRGFGVRFPFELFSLNEIVNLLQSDIEVQEIEA